MTLEDGNSPGHPGTGVAVFIDANIRGTARPGSLSWTEVNWMVRFPGLQKFGVGTVEMRRCTKHVYLLRGRATGPTGLWGARDAGT